ncbi:MAG: hypothetical protein BMS9Abin37_0840 [Acidobacteriota bacterium]|nr:MAG: hypothetical protein BMS9Abin37_0840 [Acidobacteriota bacterium]
MSSKASKEAGRPIIGLLTIELHFPEAQSLKTKRMVVKSIKDRVRRKFNVSIAETGYLDLWQRSELAVVSVSGARPVLESQIEAVSADLESRFGAELVGTSFELIE